MHSTRYGRQQETYRFAYQEICERFGTVDAETYGIQDRHSEPSPWLGISVSFSGGFLRHSVRAAKEMDSKSSGFGQKGFEPHRCRFCASEDLFLSLATILAQGVWRRQEGRGWREEGRPLPSASALCLLLTLCNICRKCNERLTAPQGLPRRSPTLVLTRPCAASLRRTEGIRCIRRGMAVSDSRS